MLGYMLDYLRRAIADPGKVVFNSKKRIAIAIVIPFLAWVVFSVMPAPGSSSRRTSERAETRMTVTCCEQPVPR